MPIKGTEKLAEEFTKIRGSKYFLIGLITFIAIWVTIHFSLGVDPEFGALNLCLSSEASIALAFFTMMADKQEDFMNKQLEYMQHLMESNLVMMKNLAKALEKKDH